MTTPPSTLKNKVKTFTRTRTGNFVASFLMFAGSGFALSKGITFEPSFSITISMASITGFFLLWTGFWHLCVGLFYEKLGAFNNRLIDKYIDRD